MVCLELLYGILAAWLALYGLNSLMLTVIYLLGSLRQPQLTARWESWPAVTVQLPIYNERHVVERLIAAVAALDYPHDLLQIQVLDDSTDETTVIAQQAVARYAQMSLSIQYRHRSQRIGFKAGALAEGLHHAKGELLAIFDADFIPPKDFLRRIVPYFSSDNVGCVQARWGHLNRTHSVLTRAQALGIDGHFIVEQGARSQAHFFLNFNGSAGVWRRACIEGVGGWHTDTLTEDLDLSYRAQLAGWRIAYVPDIEVPAELPPQMDALRRQQARWAQGSIQVARKLLWPLWCAAYPWFIKVEAALHLTGYMVHPLMLVTLLLTLPMLLTSSRVAAFVPYFLFASIGPPLLYLVAQRRRGPGWWRELRFMPFLLSLGMGLSLNNTVAMVRALLGQQEEFQRTPKFDIHDNRGHWRDSMYALHCTTLVWYETGLAAFSLSIAMLAVRQGRFPLALWLVIYGLSYSYVAGTSLIQSLQRRHKEATSKQTQRLTREKGSRSKQFRKIA
nr:glycosyltransferase [Chloroflexota bacterium]